METMDIRNALTPLSEVGYGQYQPRVLWRQASSSNDAATNSSLRPTSTPITTDSSKYGRQRRHLYADCFPEPNESPILFVHPKVNLAAVPIFGRQQSLESDHLSTTSIAATLEKMELCDNNYENINEKELLKEKKKTESTGESTSSFQAHEQFKKEIVKNKKRKSVSPRKSPKVYKTGIGKKVIEPGKTLKKAVNSSKQKASKEFNKKHGKSPKIKSPKGLTVSPFKKVIISGVSSKKTSTRKQILSGTSDKASDKKCPTISIGSECATLKTSKCARSPKLRTSVRAAIMQHRQEIRREKEKKMEAQKIKIMEEKKRLEEEETKKIRQKTIFKAQPIRKYAPLPIVKKRALTDPISPNISKKRRIEYSSQSSNSNRTE